MRWHDMDMDLDLDIPVKVVVLACTSTARYAPCRFSLARICTWILKR